MANSFYFDAHTHVQFHAFEKDYREVIDRALKNSVWLVNVGTQRDTSRRAIEVAHEFPEGVFATVGLHPIHTAKSYHDSKELGLPSDSAFVAETTSAKEAVLTKEGDTEAAKGFTSRGEEFDYEYYKKLASDPKVVAIGECGLDYFRIEGDVDGAKKKQKEAFEAQIRLANEVGKPLMIHCRNAFPDLIDILAPHASHLKPSIIHFFTGTADDVKKLLEMGFSFTFGGVITFTRDYDEAIKLIPVDKILSETDAPYVTPAPYRGKRNEPLYVIEVVKKLAELKGVSVEAMAAQIFENAKRFFSLT